ncbi:MAG: TonB family protein [Bdellovibrionales bacterium]
MKPTHEEKNNRKKGYILSLVIHGILVAYLSYLGYQYIENQLGGFTEIDFTGPPPKGEQDKVFEDGKDSVTQERADRATIAKPKPIKKNPKPKPKAPLPAPEIETADEDSDIDAGKNDPILEVPEEEVEDLATEETDQELNDLNKEEVTEFKDNLDNQAKENSTGKDKTSAGDSEVNADKKTQRFGAENGVKSYKELRPFSGNRKPVYPEVARRLKYEDFVILDYQVKRDGSVGQIWLVRAAEYEGFNVNAITAVKTWKFEPGLTGVFRHPIKFNLKDGEVEYEDKPLRGRN